MNALDRLQQITEEAQAVERRIEALGEPPNAKAEQAATLRRITALSRLLTEDTSRGTSPR